MAIGISLAKEELFLVIEPSRHNLISGVKLRKCARCGKLTTQLVKGEGLHKPVPFCSTCAKQAEF